ncbi:MAG: hypothetical protein LC650_05065 [Actinobacteria bacterium]|nr:hypothetical protein [Actinomycetota bacterium]
MTTIHLNITGTENVYDDAGERVVAVAFAPVIMSLESFRDLVRDHPELSVTADITKEGA